VSTRKDSFDLSIAEVRLNTNTATNILDDPCNLGQQAGFDFTGF
jgi:hypothetical protein